MIDRAPDCRRTVIDVPADAEVEIVREPCQCPPGRVCADDDPFAALCPRRAVRARWLVMRRIAEGCRYVRKLRPDPGDVEWTADRAAAHRFTHRSEAAYVQGCIVTRDGIAVAVVPENANERAMADLNGRAEW